MSAPGFSVSQLEQAPPLCPVQRSNRSTGYLDLLPINNPPLRQHPVEQHFFEAALNSFQNFKGKPCWPGLSSPFGNFFRHSVLEAVAGDRTVSAA